MKRRNDEAVVDEILRGTRNDANGIKAVSGVFSFN